METPNNFPAEGPQHFEQYLRNIRAVAVESPNNITLWTSVDSFGSELQYSIKQGKLTAQEAEEFRSQIEAFMSEGNNKTNYESIFPELATFWWEKGGEESSAKTP